MRTHISRIAVVVPARDEAQLLPATLTALGVATAHFAIMNPHVVVSIIVVLDSTTDGSKELLHCYPEVHVVSVDVGRVGAARNAGVAAARALQGKAPGELWIANTDADTEVPKHWLQRQFELAVAGADVVVGSAVPKQDDVSTSVMLRWLEFHQLGEGHPHIYGANLGFRADVFAALCGFRDQGLHEDRDFVGQSRALGYRVVATDTCRVSTSGRLRGRASGGFADFLSKLEGQDEPAAVPSVSSVPSKLLLHGQHLGR